GRAYGQHAHCGPAATKFGVNCQSPVDQVNRQRRAQAVANQHDFIDTRFARVRQDHICKHVEPGVDVISTVMDIVAREDPAIQCMVNSPGASGPLQESKKTRNSYAQFDREFAWTDKLEDIDRKARQKPSSEAEYCEGNQREKEKDP